MSMGGGGGSGGNAGDGGGVTFQAKNRLFQVGSSNPRVVKRTEEGGGAGTPRTTGRGSQEEGRQRRRTCASRCDAMLQVVLMRQWPMYVAHVVVPILLWLAFAWLPLWTPDKSFSWENCTWMLQWLAIMAAAVVIIFEAVFAFTLDEDDVYVTWKEPLVHLVAMTLLTVVLPQALDEFPVRYFSPLAAASSWVVLGAVVCWRFVTQMLAKKAAAVEADDTLSEAAKATELDFLRDPKTKRRVLIAIWSLVTVLGSYYMACCAFLLAFNTFGKDNAVVQMLLVLGFSVITFCSKTFGVLLCFKAGRPFTNPVFRPLLSFVVELMGELFTMMVFPDVDNVTSFFLFLAWESFVYFMANVWAFVSVRRWVKKHFGRYKSVPGDDVDSANGGVEYLSSQTDPQMFESHTGSTLVHVCAPDAADQAASRQRRPTLVQRWLSFGGLIQDGRDVEMAAASRLLLSEVGMDEAVGTSLWRAVPYPADGSLGSNRVEPYSHAVTFSAPEIGGLARAVAADSGRAQSVQTGATDSGLAQSAVAATSAEQQGRGGTRPLPLPGVPFAAKPQPESSAVGSSQLLMDVEGGEQLQGLGAADTHESVPARGGESVPALHSPAPPKLQRPAARRRSATARESRKTRLRNLFVRVRGATRLRPPGAAGTPQRMMLQEVNIDDAARAMSTAMAFDRTTRMTLGHFSPSKSRRRRWPGQRKVFFSAVTARRVSRTLQSSVAARTSRSSTASTTDAGTADCKAVPASSTTTPRSAGAGADGGEAPQRPVFQLRGRPVGTESPRTQSQPRAPRLSTESQQRAHAHMHEMDSSRSLGNRVQGDLFWKAVGGAPPEFVIVESRELFLGFWKELQATIGFVVMYSWFVKSYNSNVFPYQTTNGNFRQALLFAAFGLAGHILVFCFYLFHIRRVYGVDVMKQLFLTLRHTRFSLILMLSTFAILALITSFIAQHNAFLFELD